MSTPEHPRSAKFLWTFIVLLLFLGWGIHSGRMVWTKPSGGPIAEVHPEVLNLQSSFTRVAELVKPAVVSISTIHIQQIPAGGQEFFFGDPFEEFFQYFGAPGGGGPMPRSGPLPLN